VSQLSDSRAVREQEFWDEQVPSLQACLEEYHAGPDPNTELMLNAVEPLAGQRVLDFACGAGVTTAWLAERGAVVTGIDLSARAVQRASDLCRHVGVEARFVAGDFLDEQQTLGTYDRIVGRFALHHTDVGSVGPALATCLRDGGIGAFLETMDLNPFLRVARKYLVGRLGIPRYGTVDEQPLTTYDLRVLKQAFGELRTDVAALQFLAILDRQVLQFRWATVTRALAALDRFLLETVRLPGWSYHQVVVVRRRRSSEGGARQTWPEPTLRTDRAG
jgi:protein-L-isoaspartate O-methyltransferase